MSITITRPWALYNEIDDYAADWLENLIARGLIAPGIVDRRSIEDICPDELRGFRQVHFFAGIGVWSYSARRIGISDDTHVWTGSCPCQPFSAAGKGGGVDDERHLWPAFYHHIRERRPRRVFGEQVASQDGLGWLDIVQADLEATEYAIGAIDTCSAGFGAPHIRQRLRFAAHDLRSAAGGIQYASGDGRVQRRSESSGRSASSGCGVERLANPKHDVRWTDVEGWGEEGRTVDGRLGSTGNMAFPEGISGGSGLRDPRSGGDRRNFYSHSGSIDGLDHHHHQGLEGFGSRYQAEIGRLGALRSVAEAGELGRLADTDGWDSSSERLQRSGQHGLFTQNPGIGDRNFRPGPTNGFWRDADWLFCRDGKWRPIESGTFPLAHGAPARVGRLRAYGNAVDAEATCEFLKAYFDKDVIEIDANAEAVKSRPTLMPQFEDLLG